MEGRGGRWTAPVFSALVFASCGGAGGGPESPAPGSVVDSAGRAPVATAPDTAAAESDAGPTRTADADPGATGSGRADVDGATGSGNADEAAVGRERMSSAVLGPLFGTEPDSALLAEDALPVPILPGALLPRTRIVAFYGNPASERMGILGEVPPDEMLARLDAEVRAWREADPATPVRPALQMIAVMATGDPGQDSLYRLRMPDSRIRQVADWADRAGALLFLDVQPGHSSVEDELPELRTWLARPDVHLALDPEWAMPDSAIPGTVIGSMSAGEINYAIDFLADIVEEFHLPPKVLVVHRFTQSMIRNADAIRRDPRVQVVINMDGWGFPNQKRVAYRDIVAPEADQWTGFKLFFHNDRRDGSVLLTPTELLELDPPPIYIQYQ